MKSKWALRMYHLKLENIAKLGGECACGCGENDPRHLQFAHLKPTKLSGSGRGMGHRMYDVRRNLDHYTLLSDNGCHYEFDSGAISINAHGKTWLQSP